MNNNEFAASLKSSDTEENIDIHFYRRIGWFWARMARRLKISPNAITIASIFIGIAAGICFYTTNLPTNLVGISLLILANSLDSADGQLARLTGQYSRLGRILDGLAGDLWFMTIYIAIALRSINTVPCFHVHPWIIWLITILAAGSHIIQAALADYYRQLHLLVVYHKGELETSSHIQQSLARANPTIRPFLKLYLAYTRAQEHFTPYARQIPGANPNPATFRNGSLPLMKYANALTFNWRAITLFITIIAGYPWIYPLAEITIFNALLIYMHNRHEKLCKKLLTG